MLASELLNALTKNLQGENKASGEKESDDVERVVKEHHHGHEITHHFKVTQTTEGELSTKDTDDNNYAKQTEKKKKKRCNCLLSCFGRGGNNE